MSLKIRAIFTLTVCPKLNVSGAEYGDCNGIYELTKEIINDHPVFKEISKDRWIAYWPKWNDTDDVLWGGWGIHINITQSNARYHSSKHFVI